MLGASSKSLGELVISCSRSTICLCFARDTARIRSVYFISRLQVLLFIIPPCCVSRVLSSLAISPTAHDETGEQAKCRDQARLFHDEMRRAKPYAGIVESFSELRNVASEVMFRELKFDFARMLWCS